MNVLDSHRLEGAFAAAGCQTARDDAEADVIVLNTCSVRAHAENKVFSRLGTLKALKARRPEVIVVVAGCMAQRLGREILDRFEAVDLVVGTGRIADVVQLAQEAAGARRRVFTDQSAGTLVRDARFRCGRSQAFVSAMRGCDNFCAYCVVPYVRGRQKSRRDAEIVDEVKALADDGVKVVTLLGQNVTAYGADRGERHALSGLLAALDRINGIEWIGFLTCHPRDTGDDVFEAMRDLPKVRRYIHMPAQAGSDRVLRAMNRGYTSAEYIARVERLRETVGNVSIAGDFIVGFPGETREDFEATVGLLERVGYKNSFIFKYSPRPGTSGALLEDDVPSREKARRNNELLEVQKRVSLAHNRAFIGQKVRVFAVGAAKKGEGMLAGRTEGEEVVIFPGPQRLSGEFVEVVISDVTPIALFGETAPMRSIARLSRPGA
jgi:tRNA-2-methylthio-N6-dimethylallyladenosine synthase